MIVWAAISSRGSSELVSLEGKQYSSKYIETLDQYLFPLLDKFRGDAVIFQHDNEFESSKVVHFLDLNPIEKVFLLLARKVYSNGKQYFSVLEFKGALNCTWKELDEKSLNPFLDSLKNRV